MKPIPRAPDAYDRRDQQTMRMLIQQAVDDIQRPVGDYQIIAKPATPQRIIDANANPADTAQVLATLILDLRSKGLV